MDGLPEQGAGRGSGGSSLLTVAGLSYDYSGMRAVTDCSLAIAAGKITALIGGNGAGKTTSVKMIAGALRPRSGSITFDGVDITASPAHHTVELGLALVPEGRLVFQHLSVLENLLVSGHVRRARTDLRANLERVFGLFPRLGERRSQNAGSLSGGEQQMLAIARGLMTNPRLLVLDEPSLGLSPILVSSIFSLVRKLNKENISVLLVEQNVHQTLAIADYGYVIEKGKVVRHGEGRSLLVDPKVKEAYLGVA
jgi:branched-chain amino acid transport system ATP-binding protein